jgi:hypothetical protein
MANKNKNGEYVCSYCNKVYTHPTQADNCRDSHELIYVPITREDLNRLIQFIYLKQDELLTESLINSLTRFQPKVG